VEIYFHPPLPVTGIVGNAGPGGSGFSGKITDQFSQTSEKMVAAEHKDY